MDLALPDQVVDGDRIQAGVAGGDGFGLHHEAAHLVGLPLLVLGLLGLDDGDGGVALLVLALFLIIQIHLEKKTK